MKIILSRPKKVSMKTQLFRIAVNVLKERGWKVDRVAGSGKSSVRRITKDGDSKVVSIRTTQDTWIAFSRTKDDKGWRTLDEVDAVVPVSVDDKDEPKFALVHFIDGDEVRSRFNRAYEARKNAGHKIPTDRGVWVSLYLPEASDPVSHVGAGVGREFPSIEEVALSPESEVSSDLAASDSDGDDGSTSIPSDEGTLSIAEAKRRLAATFGVDPSSIKITVEA